MKGFIAYAGLPHPSEQIWRKRDWFHGVLIKNLFGANNEKHLFIYYDRHRNAGGKAFETGDLTIKVALVDDGCFDSIRRPKEEEIPQGLVDRAVALLVAQQQLQECVIDFRGVMKGQLEAEERMDRILKGAQKMLRENPPRKAARRIPPREICW